MFNSIENLFSPKNPYNQYVPILRQSFFERWESTVSILGGEYVGNDSESPIICMKHATINNNILKILLQNLLFPTLISVIYPKKFEFKLGVLADLLGAFVFDYIADQCYLLRKSMDDSSFAPFLILFSLPIIVVEIAAHFVSVCLRSILSSIVATTLIPVILIVAAVCEMQNIYIQNEIDEAILKSDHDDEILKNIRDKLFLVKEKNIYSIGKNEKTTYILDVAGKLDLVMKLVKSSIESEISKDDNYKYPNNWNFILKFPESHYERLEIDPYDIENVSDLSKKITSTQIKNDSLIKFLNTHKFDKIKSGVNFCRVDQETIKVFAVQKNHSSFFITNTDQNITALQKIAKCTLDSDFAVAVSNISNVSKG